ncbi:hypothetical protein DPMN_118874 [Dreissena polymorpha]|uniref:Uncharacterized protein n=1 Tax=Dreissena polymorpha TaxID=45954 RepID=A0A9D4JM59_DREPO|nr:hypothetical protein DPMN_118874 [Dreissena polymorpha]
MEHLTINTFLTCQLWTAENQYLTHLSTMEQLTINIFLTCPLWNNRQSIPPSPVNNGTTDNQYLPQLSFMQ